MSISFVSLGQVMSLDVTKIEPLFNMDKQEDIDSMVSYSLPPQSLC